MTRRGFCAAAVGATAAVTGDGVTVLVRVVVDRDAKLGESRLRKFWTGIWAEAVRDLGRGGVRLEWETVEGLVERPRFRPPVVMGIKRGVVNVVLTNRVPQMWDNGRGLSGVAGMYRGHTLCLVALDRAHGHQFPFVSVNTCLHELLHALMGDVRQNRPQGVWGEAREARTDWLVTQLWLFGSGSAIRASARRAIMAGWISGR